MRVIVTCRRPLSDDDLSELDVADHVLPFHDSHDPKALSIGLDRRTHFHKPIISKTNSFLSVRVNADERVTREAGAEQARMSPRDFMRRKALEAVEAEILNRTIVTIRAKDWEASETLLQRLAEIFPALVALAGRSPTSDQ